MKNKNQTQNINELASKQEDHYKNSKVTEISE